MTNRSHDNITLRKRLAGLLLCVACGLSLSLTVEAALRDKPDLVILDLLLPGIPGIEVARRLQESGILPGVPLIITTALAELDAHRGEGTAPAAAESQKLGDMYQEATASGISLPGGTAAALDSLGIGAN